MEIRVHQVGDLPLIYQILKSGGVDKILDRHFPMHGNRKNEVSVGQTVMIWLLYILSENDHKLSYVEDWVAHHLSTLKLLFGLTNLESKQLSDDYLESLLDQFSKDEKWSAYEQEQNDELIRVYKLPCQVARLDAVNVPSYREAGDLFKHGYSKQRRSDLPQIKLMLLSLDPLSMPISCIGAAGNQGDDPLYVPAIIEAQRSLPKTGMLYIGDSKMGKEATRLFIASSGNGYIVPLSQKYFSRSAINEIALSMTKDPKNVETINDDQGQITAQVYEMNSRTKYDLDKDFSYEERWIMVRSSALANKQINKLHKRLKEFKEQVEERFKFRQGRKIFISLEESQVYVQNLLAKYKLEDFFNIHFEESKTKHKKSYPICCHVEYKDQVIEEYEKCCGHRVYVTNLPLNKLPAKDIVPYYRQQYRIEQNFHQLLNKVTHLLPVFLKKENRIIGLIRLLILALKFVTLTQQQVREKLKETKKYLTGLVPGNRGKKVYSPTSSLLFRAFSHLKMVEIIQEGQSNFVLDPLNDTQKDILDLLNIPHAIYNQFNRKDILRT